MLKEKYQPVSISTPYITLGQLLKYLGIIDNGSMAKYFLNDNEVFVNDCITVSRGKKLYPGDKININNSSFFEITK